MMVDISFRFLEQWFLGKKGLKVFSEASLSKNVSMSLNSIPKLPNVGINSFTILFRLN